MCNVILLYIGSFTWKVQTPLTLIHYFVILHKWKPFSLWPFQDIENQLAMKSKALDELRQNYLTSESGTVPLLEDTASKIDELFQKRNNVMNQVLEFIQNVPFLFRYPSFILFVVYWWLLALYQNLKNCWEEYWSEVQKHILNLMGFFFPFTG